MRPIAPSPGTIPAYPDPRWYSREAFEQRRRGTMNDWGALKDDELETAKDDEE